MILHCRLNFQKCIIKPLTICLIRIIIIKVIFCRYKYNTTCLDLNTLYVSVCYINNKTFKRSTTRFVYYNTILNTSTYYSGHPTPDVVWVRKKIMMLYTIYIYERSQTFGAKVAIYVCVTATSVTVTITVVVFIPTAL